MRADAVVGGENCFGSAELVESNGLYRSGSADRAIGGRAAVRFVRNCSRGWWGEFSWQTRSI